MPQQERQITTSTVICFRGKERVPIRLIAFVHVYSIRIIITMNLIKPKKKNMYIYVYIRKYGQTESINIISCNLPFT